MGQVGLRSRQPYQARCCHSRLVVVRRFVTERLLSWGRQEPGVDSLAQVLGPGIVLPQVLMLGTRVGRGQRSSIKVLGAFGL